MNTRYVCQTRLPQLGQVGQKFINDAKVLVVGMGGLGCPVAQYLVAAGVGTIGIVDGDRVEERNLHRQILYCDKDIGQHKVDAAALRLISMNPEVKIIKYSQRLTSDNAKSILEKFDLIVDCTDNFESKFLLNDFTILMNKIFISASASGFEGNLMVINALKRGEGPCLRCLFPNDHSIAEIGDCNLVGILGAFVGVVGSWQAAEILKIIMKTNLQEESKSQILFFDFYESRVRTVIVKKNQACTCNDKNNMTQKTMTENLYVTFKNLQELVNVVLVDVRSNEEREMESLPGFDKQVDFLSRPYMKIMQGEYSDEFWQADKTYVLCCSAGIRAATVARKLRGQGYRAFCMKYS